MKAFLLFLLMYLCAANLSAQHRTISVLFIGNSYTSVNNLPLLLDSMMAANGDTLEWDMSAPGSYTLKMHSTDVNTLAKINAKPWDYVVLQEQSQLPSLQPVSVDSTTIPYALLLDSLIHANDSCSQTVFFETWGRKYGDASNCAAYPPVCTYDGMQQRLMESYKVIADTCHAIVAPVGEAFRTCIAFDSTVNLYQADSSHPSLEGSYLAASVFYEVLYHRTPFDTYDPGVTQLAAYMFPLFANQTVKDSLNFWNFGIYQPWAEFSWNNLPACAVEFFSKSNANFYHYWDFGDSTFSTDANPVHQYPHSYYWVAMHVVYDSCSSDTSTAAIGVGCLDSDVREYNAASFQIFPNPTAEILFIKSEPGYSGISEISVYNVMGGKALLKTYNADDFINVSTLAEGLYILQITDDEGHFSTYKFTVAR